jgi:hypothetical protein
MTIPRPSSPINGDGLQHHATGDSEPHRRKKMATRTGSPGRLRSSECVQIWMSRHSSRDLTRFLMPRANGARVSTAPESGVVAFRRGCGLRTPTGRGAPTGGRPTGRGPAGAGSTRDDFACGAARGSASGRGATRHGLACRRFSSSALASRASTGGRFASRRLSSSTLAGSAATRGRFAGRRLPCGTLPRGRLASRRLSSGRLPGSALASSGLPGCGFASGRFAGRSFSRGTASSRRRARTAFCTLGCHKVVSQL